MISECIIWAGRVSPYGYGTIGPKLAHRVIYERERGPLNGLDLHHRCGVKLCVNPDHLQPITRSKHAQEHEIYKRGAEFHARKTHCANGHEFTPENTGWNRYRNGKGDFRYCRICRRASAKRQRAARS